MPIRPVDMIMMAPKSQEASQVKHIETTRAYADHANISQGFQKEVEHNTKKPVKSVKSENKEYRYDAKEEGNGSYKANQDKKKKSKKENDNLESEDIKISSFDMKI